MVYHQLCSVFLSMAELYFRVHASILSNRLHGPFPQPLINLCINLEKVQYEISNSIQASVQPK